MVTGYIPEREFDDVWGAYLRPSGDLFEFEDVRDQPANHVWTVVETGDDSDGNWYAQPGFHIVNKLGYVMTRKPWADATLKIETSNQYSHNWIGSDGQSVVLSNDPTFDPNGQVDPVRQSWTELIPVN